mmetsp:Transcript_13290/g.38203  ORF Transcript_13290/g.38203 Transcript_13290/m.38203 type:complete len:157 (+) Transcript_13290:152-622(+)
MVRADWPPPESLVEAGRDTQIAGRMDDEPSKIVYKPLRKSRAVDGSPRHRETLCWPGKVLLGLAVVVSVATVALFTAQRIHALLRPQSDGAARAAGPAAQTLLQRRSRVAPAAAASLAATGFVGLPGLAMGPRPHPAGFRARRPPAPRRLEPGGGS